MSPFFSFLTNIISSSRFVKLLSLALLFLKIQLFKWRYHKLTNTFVHFQYFIVLIFLHIVVLQEYWVLMESRTPLKPVLGCVRIVALSITSHEQTQ